MKRILAIAATATLALSLTGCAGNSDEAICKDYISAFSQYLADGMEGKAGYVEAYTSKLSELAGRASGELKTALEADAAAGGQGYAASPICGKFYKE